MLTINNLVGVGASISTAAGVLDPFTVGAAWSLRRLLSSYTGAAVRIRADDDDVADDFGFDGNGDLVTANIATFLATHNNSTGFVVTWYDQSGNGFDLSEAIEANQPLYVASGINGKPTARFDGSNDTLIKTGADPTDFTGGNEVTIFAVYKPDAAGPDGGLLNFDGATTFDLNVMEVGSDLYFDFAGVGAGGRINGAQPVGWNGNPHVWECFRMASDDNQEIVVDGVSVVSATRTDAFGADSASLRMGASGFVHKGDVSEIIILKVGEGSTNRTIIRTDLGAYYGISV